MKLSLNIKLFITVSLLLIFIVLVVILLNTTILEKYYRHEKENYLISLYNEAVTYYQNNDITIPDSTSEFLLNLQKIDSTKNIEIVLCDLENNFLFTTSNNFLKNGFFISGGVGSRTELSLPQIYASLNNDTPYIIRTFSDNRLNSDFTTLYGKLSSDYLIFLRTPLEAIQDSVQISNKFLCLVGVICIFSSSIITYFIAKAFAKPILELNEIALRMSNLDFSKKYNVNTDDEIGTLRKQYK